MSWPWDNWQYYAHQQVLKQTEPNSFSSYGVSNVRSEAVSSVHSPTHCYRSKNPCSQDLVFMWTVNPSQLDRPLDCQKQFPGFHTENLSYAKTKQLLTSLTSGEEHSRRQICTHHNHRSLQYVPLIPRYPIQWRRDNSWHLNPQLFLFFNKLY